MVYWYTENTDVLVWYTGILCYTGHTGMIIDILDYVN